MTRWLKGAIKKMKRSPRTKRAKALRRRLRKGGDLYRARRG